MGGSTVSEARDPRNPFLDELNLEGRVGADLKMGLGSNLTLDATFFPDFGQVEVDPAVINLTDSEVFFPERRPFFTEGSNLFAPSENNYFYSRRVGGPPQGPATGEFVDYPRETTILVAGKVTGRLPSGTSIGILGALTAEEHARTFTLTRTDREPEHWTRFGSPPERRGLLRGSSRSSEPSARPRA